MKRKALAITASLLTVCMLTFSCSKDKDEATPSLNGFWSGLYGWGTEIPDQGYAFLFRADGTVRVFNDDDTTAASKAEGTYTISGPNVNTVYTFLVSGQTYSSKAVANQSFTHMTGQWGEDLSTSDGGTFYLDK